MTSAQSKITQRFADAILLGIVCYAASRIAVYFLIQPQGMAPFWFSNGVVLAVLLRRSKREWPLLLLGALGGFWANLFFAGFPLYPDLVYGIGNVIEPLITALIISRFFPRFELTTQRSLQTLFFASAFAAATVATLAWSVGPINWALWFIDDWLGILLVTPTLLVFWPVSSRFLRFSRPKVGQVSEMLAIMIGMTVVALLLATRLGPASSFLFSYSLLPFLLWATLRFKTIGATIASLLLGVLTIGIAIYGFGPLAQLQPQLIDRSLLVQIFLAIILLTKLSLGVSLEQQSMTAKVQAREIKILERIGHGDSLKQILEEVVRLVESQSRDLICSILLVDLKRNTVIHVAAPSLPKAYVQAIDGSNIGPEEGSCGAAAFSGKTVVAEEIATHPNWVKYRELALSHGLQACWSTPIFSPSNEVLGTFAIYYGAPRGPSVHEEYLVQIATHLAAIVIMKDRYEAQLRFAQRMESIGTFASGIAHDFNNILTAMLGNLEIIRVRLPREITSDEKFDTKFRLIEAAGMRATALVEQILTFSRQTGAQQSAVSLRPIVDEAIALLRTSLPKNIEVRTHFSSEQPLVIADPTQIHQVVLNILTNAAQAMETIGGIMDVSLVPETLDHRLESFSMEIKPGRYMRLTVKDTGSGINSDVLPNIFDPFFTTKEASQGTGLGLSVVHGIVKNHGGAIDVESAVGQGTTFHVYFPVS